MLKRKLWSNAEDVALEKLIGIQQDPPRWDIIAVQLAELNYTKTAKQCKDRWINNLSPLLNKNKWTSSESQELFRQYLQNGNRWKNISSIFSGRTDNAVKNQFFSVIRKSLRTMNKFLGNSCNTSMINRIRPKILAELLSPDYRNEIHSNLVHKFAFTSFGLLSKEVKESERAQIDACVKFVIEQNNIYIGDKSKKGKIKKISKSITTSRSSQTAKTIVNIQVVPADEMTIEEDEEDQKPLLASLVKEPESEVKVLKSENVQKIENHLKDLISFHETIQKTKSADQTIVKKNMIDFFVKLCDLSSNIKNQLQDSLNLHETQDLTDYLYFASKLVEFFKPEASETQQKCESNTITDEFFEHDILGSIHNFNPNKDTDNIDCIKTTKQHIDRPLDCVAPNSKSSYWEKIIAVSTQGDLKSDGNQAICLYDANIIKNDDFREEQSVERKISADPFEEMLEDFNYSDSHL